MFSPRTPFPSVLTTFRNRVGLSQAKLADRAGVDHSLISRYESGERQPTRPTVERIALALGLDPSDRIRFLESAGYAADPVLTRPIRLPRLDPTPIPGIGVDHATVINRVWRHHADPREDADGVPGPVPAPARMTRLA